MTSVHSLLLPIRSKKVSKLDFPAQSPRKQRIMTCTVQKDTSTNEIIQTHSIFARGVSCLGPSSTPFPTQVAMYQFRTRIKILLKHLSSQTPNLLPSGSSDNVGGSSLRLCRALLSCTANRVTVLLAVEVGSGLLSRSMYY